VIDGVLRGFLAMLVGFVVMAALVSAVSATLPKLIPSWVDLDGSPRRPLIIANLCWSFVSAVSGGYVTAWVARANPLDTALALAFVILVLGGLATVQARERYPFWYIALLLIVTPLGVVAGGLVRMKVMAMMGL